MAGATYEALHLFEILLRNAMDRAIARWNAEQGYTESWLLTPDPRLGKLLKAATLADAQRRARMVASRDGREALHDDVLAQMTFGTWRYLLPSNTTVAKQRLWDDATSRAFPIWNAGWEPIVRRVEAIHELRNRVAHLEPLHRGNLRRARQSMRQIAYSLGPEASGLFRERERMLPLVVELEELQQLRG